MISKIPEKLFEVRHIIEKFYKDDETLRSVYDDYLVYLKALQYWEQSSSDEAAARRSEYTQLVGELEEELMQALDKSES